MVTFLNLTYIHDVKKTLQFNSVQFRRNRQNRQIGKSSLEIIIINVHSKNPIKYQSEGEVNGKEKKDPNYFEDAR